MAGLITPTAAFLPAGRNDGVLDLGVLFHNLITFLLLEGAFSLVFAEVNTQETQFLVQFIL